MKADLYSYRFGVNYIPSRNWWYCWNDFCSDSIARDLDVIASLGADHIRMMLIWPYFQPNPSFVSPPHLERLNTLVGLARQRDLDVCASMLVGWLSGYSFKPFFEKGESIYTSERLWEAQEIYFRKVAEVLREHDNFLGFDLGNELDCCWKTDKLEDGDRWHNRMTDLVHELFPGHVHVNGVDHRPWLYRNTFSPQNLARSQKIVAQHSWAYFTGALKQTDGDPLGPPSIHLIDAMAALARSHAGDASKPLWIQEYGMGEAWVDKAKIPAFLEEATMNAIGGGVTWFTWWCSHDINPKLAFNELEYSLGLITVEQKVKPQGEVFRRLAETYRGRKLDKTKLENAPLKSPPEKHDMTATWKWLNEWIGESAAQQALVPDGV